MTNLATRRNFILYVKYATLFTAVAKPRFALALDEEPLLRVTSISDKISSVFTDSMLLDLPQVSFTTETIWTDTPQEFSGPTLRSVLKTAGLAFPARDLKLSALNDYSVICPADLIGENAPIIANRRNGNPFDIRKKGPLWLVFPYESSVLYRTETIYSLSIWHLSEISVL